MKIKLVSNVFLSVFMLIIAACQKKNDPAVPGPVLPPVQAPILLENCTQRWRMPDSSIHEFKSSFTYDSQNRLTDVTNPVTNQPRLKVDYTNADVSRIIIYDGLGNQQVEYAAPTGLFYSNDSIRLSYVYTQRANKVDTVIETYLFKDSAIREERYQVVSDDPMLAYFTRSLFDYDSRNNLAESYVFSTGVKITDWKVIQTDNKINIARHLGPLMYLFGNSFRINGMGVNNVTTLEWYNGNQDQYEWTYNSNDLPVKAIKKGESFPAVEYTYRN